VPQLHPHRQEGQGRRHERRRRAGAEGLATAQGDRRTAARQPDGIVRPLLAVIRPGRPWL
jgi:hypothetical protein